MKKLLILFVVFAVVLSFSAISYAAANVSENPEIKIVIDGKMGTYSNVPISANGRTLLPLRELLVNLGVQNDDQHIIWNSKESSVTVIKDTTKVYLKVGSNKASVNGVEKTLDVAPVDYKDRVYIPARFIAESFAKRVAWDDSTKRIYIRDEAEYNKVQEILTKAIAATDSTDRIKISYTDTGKITPSSREPYNTKTTYVKQRDRKNDISYSVSTSDYGTFSANDKFYYTNQASYSQIDISGSVSTNSDGKWEKTSYTLEKYNSIINSYDMVNLINPRDVLYAGLILEVDDKNNQYTLKGEVYPLSQFEQNDPESKSMRGNLSNFFIEVYVSKGTNYITKIVTKDTSEIKPAAGSFVSENTREYIFSDFNGNFTITLPEYIANDVKTSSKAVDIKLSDSENAGVSALKKVYKKVAIDGIYSNPYNLKRTEANLFVILKEKTDFDLFNKLSDNAKVVFLNECVQDNEGEYLGCSNVYAILVYEGKKYASVDSHYEAIPGELKLTKYNGGEKVEVVVQDKDKNTYSPYAE